jgi:type IX secretion system PorP/SprF family membrane protein
MQRFLNLVLLSLTITAFNLELKAQLDPVYSQFYSAPNYLNPALVGMGELPRFCLNYRNQWPGLPVPNAYVTYSASYDQFFDRSNSGIGLTAISDVQGDGILNTTGLFGSYSYSLQLNKSLFMRAGMELGYFQKRLNWEKLVFADQLNPEYGLYNQFGVANQSNEARPAGLTKGYLDVGAGLMLFSEQYYLGVTAKHLNSPDISFIRNRVGDADLPIFWSIHGGAQFKLSKNKYKKTQSFISPNFVFAHQKNLSQLTLGAYVGYGAVFGGAWYRHTWTNPDAAIFSVGFQKGVFKVGYSYDLTISGLSGSTSGAHEVAVTINLNQSEEALKRKNSKRFGDCLKMFR